MRGRNGPIRGYREVHEVTSGLAIFQQAEAQPTPQEGHFRDLLGYTPGC
jgi:hypothetical protein